MINHQKKKKEKKKVIESTYAEEVKEKHYVLLKEAGKRHSSYQKKCEMYMQGNMSPRQTILKTLNTKPFIRQERKEPTGRGQLLRAALVTESIWHPREKALFSNI